MSDQTIESLFTRFRDRGDPSALALVIDRSAPELLRVALHLAGNPVDAEDLLQATFLAAIERKSAFDPSRPLLPWLLGILANRAKRSRKAARRGLAKERLAGDPGADPAHEAERRELASLLDEKVRHLPERYRSVLLLALRHGLTPAEIADALHRPPATVRSQLQRGLELLRRTLPPGLATGLAVQLLPTRGVAAVRSAVLARARRAGPPLAKCAPFVLMALLPVPLGWLAWPREGDRGTPAPALASEDPGVRRRPDHETTAPLLREPVREQAKGTLLVRVTFAVDGSPGARVGVRIRPLDLPDAVLRDRWYTARDDGTLLLEGLGAGRHEIALDRAAGTTCTIDPQRRTEVALAIPAGHDVAGKVVDEHGQPVGGASILVSSAEDQEVLHEVTSTDERGRFRVRSVAPGRVCVARGTVHYCTAPLVAGGAADQTDVTLTIYGAPCFVRGRVCDEEGKPVENATIMYGGKDTSRTGTRGGVSSTGELPVPPCWARTDADGRFVIRGLFRCEGLAVPQRVCVGAPGLERKSLVVPIPAAGADVGELRLRRAATLRGTLVDAGGRPVSGAEIECSSQGFTGSQLAWGLCATTDARGLVTIEGVPPGPLEIACRDLELGQLRLALTLASAEVREARLELRAWREIAARLVDEDGNPLQKWEVYGSTAGGPRLGRSATSDREGRLRFSLCVDQDYAVTAIDPASRSRREFALGLGLRPGATEQRVVVPRALLANCTLRGRALDHAGKPVPDARAAVYAAGAAVDPETGRFALGPIPSGRYDLAVHSPSLGVTALEPVRLEPGQELDLPPLRFAQPGYVAGRVLDEGGAPARPIGLALCSLDGRVVTSARVERGEIVPPWAVQPGEYRARAFGSWGVAAPATLAEARVHIRAGDTTRLELKLAGAALVDCVVVRPESTPALGFSIAWHDARGELLWSSPMEEFRARSGTERTKKHELLPGSYRVTVVDELGRRATAPCVVASATEAPAPVVLRLR